MDLLYVWILIFGFGGYAGQSEKSRIIAWRLTILLTLVAVFIHAMKQMAGIH